jgi:hypothetical protein
MRVRDRHLVLVVVAALAMAPLALAGGPGFEVSEAVYPPQSLPIRFSHVAHLGATSAACVDCHPAARTSRSALDDLLPVEAACATCHPIDRSRPDKVEPGQPAARCVACHPGFDRATGLVPRLRVPPPNLKFDHRAHVVDRGIACVACHGDLRARSVALATRAQLPAMDLCLGCHDGTRASGRCTTCHLTGAGGRLETAFASGTLAPTGGGDLAVHGPDFARDHAAAAGADPRSCKSCHAEEACVECHAGAVKPLDFHPGEYVAMHAIDARRGRPDCTACHRVATFCVGCHARVGVAADGRGSEFVPPSAGPSERRFHPRGWVEVDDGALSLARGPDHHAYEAQRNIKQCVSCHRESFCTTCHTAEPGSPRVNPHPPDWAGSRRCAALLRGNRRMCLRCHTDATPITCDR